MIAAAELSERGPIRINSKWSKETLPFSPDRRPFAVGNREGIVFVADIEAVHQRLRTLPVNPADVIRPEPAALGAMGKAH